MTQRPAASFQVTMRNFLWLILAVQHQNPPGKFWLHRPTSSSNCVSVNSPDAWFRNNSVIFEHFDASPSSFFFILACPSSLLSPLLSPLSSLLSSLLSPLLSHLSSLLSSLLSLLAFHVWNNKQPHKSLNCQKSCTLPGTCSLSLCLTCHYLDEESLIYPPTFL